MNENIINVNGFFIINKTDKSIMIQAFINDILEFSQALEPTEISTPVVLSPPQSGKLTFKVMDPQTGEIFNVASCDELLYDRSDMSFAINLSLAFRNDTYILTADFAFVSRVTYTNFSAAISSFDVVSQKKGSISTTPKVPLNDSYSIDLTTFELTPGDKIISISQLTTIEDFAAETLLTYNPISPFTAIYILTGNIIDVDLVRNE